MRRRGLQKHEMGIDAGGSERERGSTEAKHSSQTSRGNKREMI